MKIKYLTIRNLFLGISIVLVLLSCDNDFLNENPQNELSEATFWKNENDAMLGLMGVYNRANTGWVTWGPFVNEMMFFSQWTDLCNCIRHGAPTTWPLEGLYSTEAEVNVFWTDCYDKISRANYFLDNIDKVEMNEDKKAEMKAEVKFIRAYTYFWLTQLWGDVPFPKTTLTLEEANSITRTSKQDVTNFILSELTEAASILPLKRPDDERGRVEKGAALAIKGRLLMAEKKWSEAALVYKNIMELNRYKIEPFFKKLFEDGGDNNNESIWSVIYNEGENGSKTSQLVITPSSWGGTNHTQIFQGFVDKFLMKDGKTIEESSLYDPDHPFVNRDPRLYATVVLPGYTAGPGGRLYQGHPDSLSVYGQMGPGVTGYALNKFWDHEYTGDIWYYGGDFMLIRYAEILLSRLESELESGNNISQKLLDETINKIRGRAEVNMPSVTTTNVDKLREIVRRERCVELAFEGLRYWDLLRWNIAHEVLTGTFLGMKITNNKDNYKGSYKINSNGNIVVFNRVFYDHYYKWPIPLSELDINKNLVQNPGYN